MSKRRTQALEPVVVPIEDRLALLDTFAELVSERWGYYTARRLIVKDASEKTQTEAKNAREKAKAVNQSVETLIKTPNEDNSEVVVTARDELKTARNALKEARKPFNEKMKPLASAVKYCDSVAIPDSLKELGHPIAPRFSLSEWAKKAVEQATKKK